MLLSALDPALLIYKYEDWQAREIHCFSRFEALALHRQVIRQYDQKMAMSTVFAALICQFFPWNKDFSAISELRDLRQFILQELEKALYIDTKIAGEVSLNPTGIVCAYVEDRDVIIAWEELLSGCVKEAISAKFGPQIATWETPSLREHSGPMILAIDDPETEAGTQVYHLPLVWDDDSWATQLATQDWWPDLQLCVDLYFRTNSAIRSYPGVRVQPIPFKCTEAFLKSVNRYCDEQLRRSLIEALTKKVHGVLDAGLGDEQLGEIRRFRVTRFWRVHYREEYDQLVLEEFGPHDIGGVG